MTKYLICYALPPAVAQYHNNAVADVSARFQTKPLNQRIPPHATIKIPFDTERIEEVEAATAAFAGEHVSAPMRIDGFGAFRRNVIYMNIDPSDAAHKLVHDYLAYLSEEVPWLPFYKYDREKKLHATIAKRDIEASFDEIWRYLHEMYDPHFDIALDNLTILKNENKRWYVHKRFNIVSDILEHNGASTLH